MSTLRDAKAYSTHRRLTYNNNKAANITSTECYTECKKTQTNKLPYILHIHIYCRTRQEIIMIHRTLLLPMTVSDLLSVIL